MFSSMSRLRRSLSLRAKSIGSGGGVDNRLNAGATVAFIGDSIFEYNNSATTGISNFQITANAQGELQQVLSMYPAFNIDTWPSADTYDVPYGREFYGANQGYAGQTSTTILNRKSNVLSQSVDLYVWAAGTNDGLENAPAQTTAIANAQSFANDVIAAGKRLLLVGVRPTGTAQNTANRIAGRKAVNTGLAAIAAANPGVVYFIDLWTAYDPNGDDVVDVGFMADALHPTPAGAYAAAVGGLLSMIQSIIKPGDIMDLNQNAELLPAISGTGGTNGIGANLTGTIPTGWTIDYGSGTTGTVVASVSGGVMTLVITPDASGSSVIRVRPTTGITTVSGTDWVKMSADIESNGLSVFARLTDSLSVSSYYASGMVLNPAVQALQRIKSITPTWLAKSTSLSATIRITSTAGAAPFTVKIYGVSAKKQTSPKTARNAGSVPTVSVAPTAPTGTPTVGQVLTANTGTWTNNSSSVAQTYAYRWYRDGVFRGSSTGTASTYTLVAGDSGTTITCGVSSANPAGRSTESVSPGVLIS